MTTTTDTLPARPDRRRTQSKAKKSDADTAPPGEVRTTEGDTAATTSVVANTTDTGVAESKEAAEPIDTAQSREAAEPGSSDTTTTTESAAPVDPFDYNESTLTLSLSFLPLVAGAAGRQVIVSVHSKNGTSKSVLPEFIAPLNEADLKLPNAVLALIERYRTTVLPKRKADAAAKSAALAAKRPVTSKKGKEARPEHVTTGTTTRRVQGAVVNTQLKLSFKKGTTT